MAFILTLPKKRPSAKPSWSSRTRPKREAILQTSPQTSALEAPPDCPMTHSSSRLPSNPNTRSKTLSPSELKAEISTIKRKKGNSTCADCPAKYPSYAVITFGILICAQCVTHHRRLGHRVKCLSFDELDSKDLATLKEIGNRRSNRKHLAMLPEDHPPYAQDVLIRKKYADKLWLRYQRREAKSSSTRSRSRTRNRSKPKRRKPRNKEEVEADEAKEDLFAIFDPFNDPKITTLSPLKKVPNAPAPTKSSNSLKTMTQLELDDVFELYKERRNSLKLQQSETNKADDAKLGINGLLGVQSQQQARSRSKSPHAHIMRLFVDPARSRSPSPSPSPYDGYGSGYGYGYNQGTGSMSPRSPHGSVGGLSPRNQYRPVIAMSPKGGGGGYGYEEQKYENPFNDQKGFGGVSHAHLQVMPSQSPRSPGRRWVF